jgi:hypothetical protein
LATDDIINLEIKPKIKIPLKLQNEARFTYKSPKKKTLSLEKGFELIVKRKKKKKKKDKKKKKKTKKKKRKNT